MLNDVTQVTPIGPVTEQMIADNEGWRLGWEELERLMIAGFERFHPQPET